MSNWCNNYLEFTTKMKPEWVYAEHVGDDAMPLPFSDHYAFWIDVKCVWSNGEWEVHMLFQTKWTPPIGLYDWLAEDPNTLELYADYNEPGCLIIGYYDMEWDHELEWPDRFYSETLDLEVHLTQPDKMFIEIEWDNFILFEDYLKDMHEAIIPNTNEIAIEDEIQECAEQLWVNLEDQKWVELVASFTS